MTTATPFVFEPLDRYNTIQKEIAAEHHVPIVDVAELFRAHPVSDTERQRFLAGPNWVTDTMVRGIRIIPESELFPFYPLFIDPFHPAAAGHELIAAELARIIQTQTPR